MRSATLPYPSRTAVTTGTSSSSNSSKAVKVSAGADEAELDEEDVFLDSPVVKDSPVSVQQKAHTPPGDGETGLDEEKHGIVEI